MPILSYLILPVEGAADRLTRHLKAIPGCEVERAENRDLLILITETSGEDEELVLQTSLAQLEGIRSMSLTFGGVAR